MADLLKAAADARVLLRGFKALQEVADALEDAGKAQQHAEEARAMLAALLPQIVAAEGKLENAREEAARAVADAKAEAARTKDAAKAKAEEIVARAAEREAAASRTVDEAKAAGKAAAALADDTVREAKAKRDALQAECFDFEKRVDAAKERIAKLLGA